MSNVRRISPTRDTIPCPSFDGPVTETSDVEAANAIATLESRRRWLRETLGNMDRYARELVRTERALAAFKAADDDNQ